MLDGAAKISPMLAEAQRLEMPAVGMTDHGNMSGASEFYNKATEVGMRGLSSPDIVSKAMDTLRGKATKACTGDDNCLFDQVILSAGVQ